jgi:hypothetical protein
MPYNRFPSVIRITSKQLYVPICIALMQLCPEQLHSLETHNDDSTGFMALPRLARLLYGYYGSQKAEQ